MNELIRPLPVKLLPHPLVFKVALLLWRPVVDSDVRPVIGVDLELTESHLAITATAEPLWLTMAGIDAAWLSSAIVDAFTAAIAANCTDCSKPCPIKTWSITAAVKLDSSTPLNTPIARRIVDTMSESQRGYLAKLDQVPDEIRDAMTSQLREAGGPLAVDMLEELIDQAKNAEVTR